MVGKRVHEMGAVQRLDGMGVLLLGAANQGRRGDQG
jgi:hypothetical protein